MIVAGFAVSVGLGVGAIGGAIWGLKMRVESRRAARTRDPL